MKPAVKIILAIALTTFIFSCDQSNRKPENRINYTMTDSVSSQGYSPSSDFKGTGWAENEHNGSVSAGDYFSASNYSANGTAENKANGFISSSAAVESGKDTTRKFIRTANMKFRVKSVLKATISIEDIAKQFGGFVTYTNLNSTIDNISTIPVNADSSLETIYFTVANSIILRVPNTKLDTALRTIGILVDYLDHRIIKADDVKLQLLENQMTQARVSKSGERLRIAIDSKGRKLDETTEAEERLLNKQEQSDNARIASLSLQDQVNFSTINLSLYQRQTIKREVISNNKNIHAYQPGFGSRLKEAFITGWNVFEYIIIFLTQIWGLILFLVVAYVLYRVFRYKRKK